MPGSFGQNGITLTCSKCGRQFAHKPDRIKPIEEVVCTCGHGMRIDGTKYLADIDSANQARGEFRSRFKKR